MSKKTTTVVTEEPTTSPTVGLSKEAVVEAMTEGLPIEGTEEETEGIGEGVQLSGQTADGETSPPAQQLPGIYLLTGFKES